MSARLNVKAIFIGIVVFVLAVLTLSTVTPLFARRYSELFQRQSVRIAIWSVSMLVQSMGGYVSGLIARQRGTLMGVKMGELEERKPVDFEGHDMGTGVCAFRPITDAARHFLRNQNLGEIFRIRSLTFHEATLMPSSNRHP